MNIDNVLSRLKQHDENFSVALDETLAGGQRRLTLESTVPSPPYPAGDRRRWYSLVLEEDQTDVSLSEITAILRRFWHLELRDFFVDEND